MRRDAGLFALLLLGLAVALGCSSCAGRQSTLASSRKAVAVAWDVTTKIDEKFQRWESLSDPAKGAEYNEGMRLLDQHEAKVRRISGLLAVAYSALDAAVLVLDIVEKGDASPEALGDVSLKAVSAALRLRDAVKEVLDP